MDLLSLAATITGALATLLAGAASPFFKEALDPLISKITEALGGTALGDVIARNARSKGETYQERMESLSTRLSSAAAEVDLVLSEMTSASKSRQEALQALELELEQLANQRQEIQERIDALQQVPLPAVEHFLNATSRGERKSALRDHVLFGLGVIVSTAVTIILKLAFDI